MVVLLMTLTAVLFAQPGDIVPKVQGMPGRAVQMRGQHMNAQRGAANGLNLTDAQKTVFKASALSMHKQLQPLRNELGEAEAHQKTLMTAEKADLGAINKNIERIGGIRMEMAKIQAKNHVEMRAQLTDEQKLKFDLFKDKQRMGKGPKGMKSPRGPKGLR